MAPRKPAQGLACQYPRETSMNYYVHRALHKAGFFDKINLILGVTLRGRRFRLPVVRGAGYHNVTPSEAWMSELLEGALASRPGAVLDVGMNIGQTLLKVASIDPSRRYLGFEPNPLCYYVCHQLVLQNQLEGYSLFPVGLSDSNTTLDLYLDCDYASGASVLSEFRENKAKHLKQRMNIAVFSGDSIAAVQSEPEIAVMKLDIEGAELEAVKGLRDTIARTRPLIVLEILPVYSIERPTGQYRKARQDQLTAELQKLGYRMFLIHEKARTLEPLESVPIHGDMNRTNYLFAHIENGPSLGGFSTSSRFPVRV
ncbi:MAG TPA: FkbM family methyltransferase [Kofleriaceae bacterium]